jgi:cobalt/nickel transport protein
MNKKLLTNALLVVAVVALIVLPLALAPKGAEFSGTDDQAAAAIVQLQPGYTPWFHPFWVPPSPEIEGLLFALQASLGTGFVAYFFGYKMGFRKAQAQSSQAPSNTGLA